MTARRTTSNRAATDRLRDVIDGELSRRNITAEEAARDARLPSSAFRSLVRKGRRPTVDRAEALLSALGLSMVIGVTPPDISQEPDDGTNRE